jgi:hypothetical protein
MVKTYIRKSSHINHLHQKRHPLLPKGTQGIKFGLELQHYDRLGVGASKIKVIEVEITALEDENTPAD